MCREKLLFGSRDTVTEYRKNSPRNLTNDCELATCQQAEVNPFHTYLKPKPLTLISLLFTKDVLKFYYLLCLHLKVYILQYIC